MRILERHEMTPEFPRSLSVLLFSVALATLTFVGSGCRKDAAEEASDSDANGYICVKCEAKLYTERSVFIGPKCPKCQQAGLVEVVCYVCPKDNHVTIRGRTDERHGAPVCEACQGPLSGMRLPREKDLKAWGATKVSS
jgi:ribosomal protein L40E